MTDKASVSSPDLRASVKTTAINEFAFCRPDQAVVIKVSKTSKTGVGARVVMQETINALRVMLALGDDGYMPTDTYAVRSTLSYLVKLWESHNLDTTNRRLTFIYDEAQTFSRDAIETLRYWNDRDRCFASFPIGLAFVGNEEFALQAGKNQQSVISAAVADRARYTEIFKYADVGDGDLRLILAAHGIEDEMVVAHIVKRYSSGRRTRSIRRLVEQDIPDMRTVAGDGRVTLDIVREALAA